MAAQATQPRRDLFFEKLVRGDADAAVDPVRVLPGPLQPHERQQADRRQAESRLVGKLGLEGLAVS